MRERADTCITPFRELTSMVEYLQNIFEIIFYSMKELGDRIKDDRLIKIDTHIWQKLITIEIF